LSVLFSEIKKRKGEVLVKRKSSGETKNEGETRMKQLEVKKKVVMDIKKREAMDTLLISVAFEGAYMAGSTCFLLPLSFCF